MPPSTAKTPAIPEPVIVTVNVTITSTVDPEWIDLVVNCNDLFMRDYCGYWARSMIHSKLGIGWLIAEIDDNGNYP